MKKSMLCLIFGIASVALPTLVAIIPNFSYAIAASSAYYGIAAFLSLIALGAGIVGIVFSAKEMKANKEPMVIAALVISIIGTVWGFSGIFCYACACSALSAAGAYGSLLGL